MKLSPIELFMRNKYPSANFLGLKFLSKGSIIKWRKKEYIVTGNVKEKGLLYTYLMGYRWDKLGRFGTRFPSDEEILKVVDERYPKSDIRVCFENILVEVKVFCSMAVGSLGNTIFYKKGGDIALSRPKTIN